MSELSGLELRKAACEALGWTESGRGWFHAPTCDGKGTLANAWKGCDFEHHSKHLPAIESDPAVSEPMFLEWIGRRGFAWTMESGYGEPDSFRLAMENIDGIPVAVVYGSTPSEARARAIVEATK